MADSLFFKGTILANLKIGNLIYLLCLSCILLWLMFKKQIQKKDFYFVQVVGLEIYIQFNLFYKPFRGLKQTIRFKNRL